MAYQDNETGFTTGRPIELYKFTGTFNNYFLTSYSEVVTSGGEDYTPTAINRNQLKVATQEQTENAIEITIPFDHPLAQEYAYQTVPPSLEAEIIRCHEDNYNDTVVNWKGKVTSFSVQKRLCKMKIPTVFSYVLEGALPAPRFQAPCNHILYDDRCGVNPLAHQHTTTITSIAGNALQVADLPFSDNEAAAGVIFSTDGEQRMVISNAGTLVDISFPFAGLNVGDSVTIRKGCNHSLTGDCQSKFNNSINFGGFPLVPGKNPFTGTLQ